VPRRFGWWGQNFVSLQDTASLCLSCVAIPLFFSFFFLRFAAAMARDLQNPNFYCPITDEIMKDPVIDYEGNSYERNAIEEWLRMNGTSPITRNPLSIAQLVPNRSLRNAIEDELLAQNNHRTELSPNISQEEKLSSQREMAMPGMAPSVSLAMASQNETILLSVYPSDENVICPLDVVCVVDVSGSMGEAALLKGTEDNGFTLLDIVKHALKTIVVTLSENDRLSLVTYSNEAHVVFTLTPLNSPGRARVNRLIDSLTAGGMTNLWDGLEKGLDVLTTDQVRSSDSLRNSAIFLLTDGVPNVDPPRGYVHRLRRYRDSHGGIYPAVINTFGFGYNLKRFVVSLSLSLPLSLSLSRLSLS
jgi:uncharacterized protein YegL